MSRQDEIAYLMELEEAAQPVETCAECGDSVEDDQHANGCDHCACPLHLQPGD